MLLKKVKEDRYTLYGISGAGSLVVAFVMEEIGLNYKAIFPSKEERETTDFRKISPSGCIPVLVTPSGFSIFESLAITIFLTEKYPRETLIAPIGDSDRASCWQWLAYLGTSLYNANIRFHYPEKFGDNDVIKNIAENDRRSCYNLIEEQPGKFLAGDKISVADFYLYMLMEWDDEKETELKSKPRLQKIIKTIHNKQSVQKVMIEQPEDV